MPHLTAKVHARLLRGVPIAKIFSVKTNAVSARLIYPPHPAITWRPERLDELKGYVAQYKYDDWRILVYFVPGAGVQLFGRRKAPLPRYRPPEQMLRELNALPVTRDKLQVLDGGLLHYKTSRIKDTLVFWDILIHDGRYLLGTTYRERYDLLTRILGTPVEPVSLSYADEASGVRKDIVIATRASRHIWLAHLLQGDFQRHFREAAPLPEIEGLVLKDPNARLTRAHRAESNASWQIRARKPGENYEY
ncbi:MAG: hypothetical protein A2X94_08710 [Bdellovibrionales bacterium GWB1_55_8]|nr:MAG: hypothetical protein A2X94_08710 [Bdellovibrionales bacterium GWB1_55_8]